MSSIPTVLAQPPKNTPFDTQSRPPNPVWQRWVNNLYGVIARGIIGVGNGANANIQCPAPGTGTGPANPLLVVGWRQININGTVYWTPLFQ